MSAQEIFYESGLGDKLAEISNFPKGIKEFLQVEQQALNSIEGSFDVLIEVGCMYGLHLDWTITHTKLYKGIDPVKRYVETGTQTIAERGLSSEHFQFIVGKAEELLHVIDRQHPHIEPERCLLFFPFNSFGNMLHIERVVDSLRESELPFLISSYQTSRSATKIRDEYYKRCGYQDIQHTITEMGICFSSLEGLHSIAYQPNYLRNFFDEHNLPINVALTPPINMFYTRGVHLDMDSEEETEA